LLFLNIDLPIKAPAITKPKIRGETIKRQIMPSPKNIKLSKIAMRLPKIEHAVICVPLMLVSFQNQAIIIPIKSGIITNSEKTSTPTSLGSNEDCIPIIRNAKMLAIRMP
jgi:hypothetical protein